MMTRYTPAFQLIAELNNGFKWVGLNSSCGARISAAHPPSLERWIKKSWACEIGDVRLIE